MNHPELYARVNDITKKGTTEMLKRIGPKLIWNKDKEVALDIGCGPGDVTKEVIFPLLPGKSSRIVGIDKVDTMVEYARKHYSNDAITFEKQNIMQLYKSKLISDEAFTKDVEDIIPKYQDFQGDPAEDFGIKATRAGFQVEHCEVREFVYNFDPPIETVKELFDSLNPFSIRMMPSEKNEYLEECFEEVLKLYSRNAKGGLAMNYKNLEAALKKPN